MSIADLVGCTFCILTAMTRHRRWGAIMSSAVPFVHCPTSSLDGRVVARLWQRESAYPRAKLSGNTAHHPLARVGAQGRHRGGGGV